MNQVAKVEKKESRHLIEIMASNANLDMQEYARTIKRTCGMAKGTDEELVAFLMVARRYDLDPLLKEIYAFPAKGGGIVPIVSIDGWVNLINSHPQFNGMEFTVEERDGKLFACTCSIYRKDRERPTTITEYLSECKRNTDPWKMEHRMLRHKALIQCARYAFGFSGIYDQDEAEKIADMRDITPAGGAGQVMDVPPPPPAYDFTEAGEEEAEEVNNEAEETRESQAEDHGPDEAGDDGDQVEKDQGQEFDANGFLNMLKEALDECSSLDEIEEEWERLDVDATLTHHPKQHGIAKSFMEVAKKSVGKASK